MYTGRSGSSCGRTSPTPKSAQCTVRVCARFRHASQPTQMRMGLWQENLKWYTQGLRQPQKSPVCIHVCSAEKSVGDRKYHKLNMCGKTFATNRVRCSRHGRGHDCSRASTFDKSPCQMKSPSWSFNAWPPPNNQIRFVGLQPGASDGGSCAMMCQVSEGLVLHSRRALP